MIASEKFLQHVDNESSHHLQNLPPPPRTFGKWCGYALVLLMPGSFEVLTLLWLYRRCVQLYTNTKLVAAPPMRPASAS